MATTKGSSGVVKLAVSGGSVAAMGEVRSFTLDETADTIEDSVMGDTARTYLSSLTSATLSMDVYWDDADAVQLVMDSGADLIWELYPTGTGTGEKYYSGSGILTSKSLTASFDGMVEGSFALQVSGAVTEATA
jgi:hypothetical protein